MAMKKLLSVAAAAATILISGFADARIPSDRMIALTPDWAINKPRQADSYLIATVDRAGHVIRLCGNVSHQCIGRVYRTKEPASPE
jgi:hypothetical protein